MAKVLPDPDRSDGYTESSFVRVRTYPIRRCRSVTLASIEHFEASARTGGLPRHSRTLIEDEPMSHEDAMSLAQSYCDQCAVAFIYECRDDGDFTDTVILPG